MSKPLTYLNKKILPPDLMEKVTEFERASSFLEKEGFHEASKELLLQADYIILEYAGYHLFRDLDQIVH